MDQSILNELNGMKDAFQNISNEIGRVGSLLEKVIEKTTANANRPALQSAPSFYPQLPMNQPFYMMHNGQFVPMFPFQPSPFQGYFSTNQVQIAPTTQTQSQMAETFQASQAILQTPQTVEQNIAANTPSTSAFQEVIENVNHESTCVHEHESDQPTLEESVAGVSTNPSDNQQSQNFQLTNENPVIENNNSCSREVNGLVQSTVEVNLPASTSSSSTLQLTTRNGLHTKSNSSQNSLKEEYNEVSLFIRFVNFYHIFKFLQHTNNVNVNEPTASTSNFSQNVQKIKEHIKVSTFFYFVRFH